ncbi:MAG TPA: hypothetical protein VEX87_01760 [Skermanella sp.]|nr:hypothetical protein [Skermanella sp.]
MEGGSSPWIRRYMFSDYFCTAFAAGCCQFEGKLPTAGAVMVARGRSDQFPCPHVGASGQLGQDRAEIGAMAGMEVPGPGAPDGEGWSAG